MPDETLDRLSPEARATHWRQWLGTTYLVAEHDGAVAGFAIAGPCRDEDATPSTGELIALNVDPAAWGSGCGAALVAAAERTLAARAYADAVLWVIESNERARRLYERAGWTADGESKQSSIGGAAVPEVRYRKVLGAGTWQAHAERVLLRLPRASDARDWRALPRDAATVRAFGGSTAGLRPDKTTADAGDWLRTVAARGDWIIEHDGRAIGTLLLTDRGAAKARLSVEIFDPALRGRGLGTEAVGLALREAFAERGHERVELVVYTDNAPAIACYEKCGFRREGVMRHVDLVDGEWKDDLVMAILAGEWRAAVS
ncbi:MAG: GNAT family N-acetyltransferase [Vicinamibacteria bacterium]